MGSEGNDKLVGGIGRHTLSRSSSSVLQQYAIMVVVVVFNDDVNLSYDQPVLEKVSTQFGPFGSQYCNNYSGHCCFCCWCDFDCRIRVPS